MSKTKLFSVLVAGLLLSVVTSAQVTVCTSTKNGNADNNSTWGGTAFSTCQQLVIAHKITFEGDMNLSGITIIIKNGGSINLTGGAELNLTDVTITVESGGVIDVNGDLNLDNSSITIEGGGEVTIKGGGNLDLDNSPLIIETGGQLDGAGTITAGTYTYEDDEFPDIVTSGGLQSSGALPIELVYFSATQVNNQVVLKWETATEKNNAYMEVQRSKDGIQFMPLHREKGHGTTATPQQYSWTDAAPLPGLNYYRLRQVDLDGKWEYHVIVAVEFTGKTAQHGMHLYPTEVRDQLTLVLDTPATQDADIWVTDMSGRTLQRRRLAAGSSQELFVMNDLVAGAYTITVQSGKGIQAARFVKLQ